MAVHLLQHYSERKPQLLYTGGLPKYQLQRVLDYIHAHLDQNIKLSDMASVLGMSQYYFCRLFKQSIGIAPHQYLTQCRIERAQQLLLQSEMTVAEIALEVGFVCQSSFTRLFGQLTGMTPKAYRNER